MTTHSSATAHEETTISDVLRRRAQTVITNQAIDPRWRTIIRYAIETNDPQLAELVDRAAAGERIIDTFESLANPLVS